MKKIVFKIAFMLLFSSLLACGMVKGKGEAEKVAQSLFKERIEKNTVSSSQHYSDLFWKNTSKKKWGNITNLVNSALGNLKSYNLQSWNINSKINTSQLSGTIVVLVYETVYEKGKGIETLGIHKPLMSEKYSIISHNFNSEKIQELIDKGIEQVTSENAI